MRAAIVLGGDLCKSEKAVKLLNAAQLCIAADSGADNALQMGSMPDMLLGDMDSISAEVREKLADTETVLFPTVKDATDGELAIDAAIKCGADAVDIFCAAGGRLDHMFANFFCAIRAAQGGLAVRFVTDREIAYLSTGKLEIKGEPGATVSIIPLLNDVENVTAQGFAYPLDHEKLSVVSSRGISNILQNGVGQITHDDGVCLVTVQY